MPFFPCISLLAAALVLWSSSAFAQADIPVEKITVEGATQLKGELQGPHRDMQDYLVHAVAGSTLSVAMKTDSKSIYFNVLSPGGETTLYTGMVQGDYKWKQKITQDGDYTIRVYLVRAAARQGKSARYALQIATR